MDLKAWRKQREEQVELPSGLEVRLRRVSLLDLVMGGEIPTPLLGLVDELTGKEGEEQMPMSIDVAEFPKFSGVFNELVLKCVIDPPVKAKAGADALGIDEIPAEDKIFIFQWANQGAAELKPFRGEAGEPGDAALSGNGVPSETKQPAGDQG